MTNPNQVTQVQYDAATAAAEEALQAEIPAIESKLNIPRFMCPTIPPEILVEAARVAAKAAVDSYVAGSTVS